MSVDAWDHRELCPDGGCIGVIGPDGTCKTCGRAMPNWGDPRRRGLVEPDDEDEADDAAEPAEPAEWSERRLCDDGACVGVVGRDGRCGVCGQRAEGAPVAPPGDGDDEPDDDDEPEDEACADEACDGVIVEDGLCATCGKPAPDDDDDADDDDESGGDDAPAREGDADERRLCPDGACVGLIGDDGHCKVCGKAAA